MSSLFEQLGTACLAPTPDAPLGYRKCNRCRGTGIYSQYVRRVHMGAPGVCLECDGAGRARISTPQEIADAAAAKKVAERRSRLLEQLKSVIMPDHDNRAFALIAIDRLQTLEPERYQRMLDSVEAGRIADVVRHLVAYYHETKV